MRSQETTPTTGRSRQPGCGCTGGGKFWETNGAKITRQLRPRQQRSRPLGGLQQRRVPLCRQLHLGQRRRRHHVRDELQRGDHAQHLRPERACQRSHQSRDSLPPQSTSPSREATTGSKGRTTRHFESRATCSPTTGPASWRGRTRIDSLDLPLTRAPASARWSTLPSPPLRLVRTKSKINKQPFFDDCRWKTQNVVVDGNVFASDPAKIPWLHTIEGLWVQRAFLQLRQLSTVVAL